MLAGYLDFAEPPQHTEERRGDVRDSLADISAAADAFGYKPHVSFEEGLRRTVDWYVRQTAPAFKAS